MDGEELKKKFNDLILKNREQKQQINSLLEAMGRIPQMGGPINVQVQQAVVEPAVVRSDKIQPMA